MRVLVLASLLLSACSAQQSERPEAAIVSPKPKMETAVKKDCIPSESLVALVECVSK